MNLISKAAAAVRYLVKKMIRRGTGKVENCPFHSPGLKLQREEDKTLGLRRHFCTLDSSFLKNCGGTTDANTYRTWYWPISS